jgi:4'-phosphopantetheinyl transferase
MPVIFEKQIDATKKLAVWHITEQVEELYALCEYVSNPLLTYKRNLEIAVSRLLLNYLLGINTKTHLQKDENGKPFLLNHSASISFSHSKNMVACMVNKEGEAIGIDIEQIRDRIKLIAPKFVTSQDNTGYEEIQHSHIVWGAKEVLYKIYSLKQLDFRDHMHVEFKHHNGIGYIHKNDYNSTHQLEFTKVEDFMLVWGF